jgi:hypothetical protein
MNILRLIPSDIPGLYDLELDDEIILRDATIGQVNSFTRKFWAESNGAATIGSVAARRVADQ